MSKPDEDQEIKNEEVVEEAPLHALEKVREVALKWSPAFEMTILLSIALISILIRVFSVIRNYVFISDRLRVHHP
jgi:hypothetical protein